jgi:hypothetical protein
MGAVDVDGKVSIWGVLLSTIGSAAGTTLMGASSDAEMAFLPILVLEATRAMMGTSPLLPPLLESTGLLGF